jgi:uncharacterized protein YndB with AHSA1/START domain
MNFTDITVNRTIPASPEKIYDVWIDPKSPGGPWHGAERVIFNPVVDGLYYLAIKHEGRVWPHYGRFTKLERPRLVEFTWMSEGTKGAESVVTVTLQPRGTKPMSPSATPASPTTSSAASIKKAGPGSSTPWPTP